MGTATGAVNGASMDLATGQGRRLSGGTFAMFFAAGAALLMIFSYAPDGSPPAVPTAVVASVGLVDDDGERALFAERRMVPGQRVSRCLTVTYGGPQPDTSIHLSAATDTAQPLARYLDLKVEQGAGGSFAGCAGFVAANEHPVVFHGALADLVDANPAAPRTDTRWRPADGESRTFRFTVTLRDVEAAQSRRSTATFSWFIPGWTPPAGPAATSPPSSPPPAAQSPAPPADPGGVPAEPVASLDPVPGPPETVEPTTSASITGRPGPARLDREPVLVPAPEADRPEAAPAAPKPRLTRIKERLSKITREITEVAMRTSSHGALPVTVVVVLVGFLAMQNRIDRLDPKLALAPMKDPHLTFTDPDVDEDVPADDRAAAGRTGVP